MEPATIVVLILTLATFGALAWIEIKSRRSNKTEGVSGAGEKAAAELRSDAETKR